MRFNFRKIASVLASAVMLGSTMGVALAANYPAPLVVSGAEDGAIVVGSAAAGSDWAAATTAANALTNLVSTTGTTASVSGEAIALFSSSSKVWLNDSINSVKSALTETELSTVLADGDFEGDVSADYVQTIKIGDVARAIFGQQPTSDDDPVFAVNFSTAPSTSYLYNASISFDQAVNFSHADSEGEKINLFGEEFTIGTATTTSKIVMFKSSQTVTLSIGGDFPTSQTVTVDGKEYTVELVSASDTSANIKITDSDGNSDSKSVTEDTSKKVQGLELAVNSADETNFGLVAEISVGAQKVTLQDGNEVKTGSDDTSIDGTLVDFESGNPNNITIIQISVGAPDSDSDAFIEGTSFTDPVFGSIKFELSAMSIPESSTTARELFEIKNSGNDKATLKMKTHTNDENTINWFYNASVPARLSDSTGDRIKLREMAYINKSEYVVVGNEDDGYLLEVKAIKNASSGFSDDEVTFKDVFSAKEYKTTITADGSGTVTIGGKTYTVKYAFTSTTADVDRQVRLNYPDSAGNFTIVFPTIETSKGAKMFLYEPLTINLSNWDGDGANVSTIQFPDGDGYTNIVVEYVSFGNFTVGGFGLNLTGTGRGDTTVPVGKLYYSFNASHTANDTAVIYLRNVANSSNIIDPAVVFFEEKDDNTNYEAVIVKMDAGGTSNDGVGVDDVETTWGADATWDEIQLETNDDLYKSADLWGTVITTDRSESDQYVATISYPEDQVYPQIYVGAVTSAITAATAGGSGGRVLVVKDSEVSSVKTKNLVVVGGSCVNSVAAKIIGATYPTCGADWTTKTSVGSGQYIIKAVKASEAVDGGSETKVAVLVAGYEAADTVNAVNKLKEAHATDTGTSNVYPVASA